MHPIIPIHIHIFVVVVLDISSPLSQCSHYKYNNKQLAGNNVGICSLRALTSQIYSFSVFYEFLIVIKTISGGEIDKLFGTNIKNLIKMFLFFVLLKTGVKSLRITIARCFTGNRNLKLVFTKPGVTAAAAAQKQRQKRKHQLDFCSCLVARLRNNCCLNRDFNLCRH